MKKEIEELVIEKLGQLERGELEDSPCGKALAEGFKEVEEFVEMYEKSKLK